MEDTACLIRHYESITRKLERQRFNLPAAIELCEETEALAKQTGSLASEALAKFNLFRFHDALGNKGVAIEYLERAGALYGQVGGVGKFIIIKTFLLEYQMATDGYLAVKPRIEALLKEAMELGDTSNYYRIHLRMIDHAITAGDYEGAEEHVRTIEQLEITSPVHPHEFHSLILVSKGRGDLAKAKGDLGAAETFYRKGLVMSQRASDKWQEISNMQLLAGVKWEKGEADSAKFYLNLAQEKGESLHLHDLLSANYARQAEIAEAEKRPAEALAFTKKKLFHEREFDNRKAGFDLERHQLKKEKEHLLAEKEERENELKEKEAFIQRGITFSVIGLALMAVLLVGYIRRQRRRDEKRKENSPETKAPLYRPENEQDKPGPSVELSAEEAEWMRDFEAHIAENLSDSNLAVAMLARHFAMSESSLLRQVKRLTGASPQQFIKEMRLQHARKMLEEQRHRSVARLASKVGYGDARSFSRSFKKRFGKLPSDFISN